MTQKCFSVRKKRMALGDEGCADVVFGFKMCEKYPWNERFLAFMDLEKAYDKTDRNAKWPPQHR